MKKALVWKLKLKQLMYYSTITSILERVILYPPSLANACSTVVPSPYFEKYSTVMVSPNSATSLSILHSTVDKKYSPKQKFRDADA